MSTRSNSILEGLTRVRSAFKSKTDDDDFEEALDLIAQNRQVLLLDAIAEREIHEFLKQWIYFNSPPSNYVRGRSVLEWAMTIRAHFLILDFHPDNLRKIWSKVRDSGNPSILQFLVEATAHFRLRVIANEEELNDLIEHLAAGLSFIHTADVRLIDTVAEAEDYVTDEQFHDDLPAPEDIRGQLLANPWLIPIVYLHRLTVEQFDVLGELIYKQTLSNEKKTNTAQVAPPPQTETHKT